MQLLKTTRSCTGVVHWFDMDCAVPDVQARSKAFRLPTALAARMSIKLLRLDH
jgi:hypothetical protein